MKKLRNLLLSGLAALALTGCTETIEGEVVWEGKTENEIPLSRYRASYKIQDSKKEVTCVTLNQTNFHPFKIGIDVELKINTSKRFGHIPGGRTGYLPGKYINGKVQKLPCYGILKYEIIKVEKVE